MSHMCPNCGFEMTEGYEEICPNCGFDFNDTLSCPYKISNRCVFNQVECKIQGLDYESCSTYGHKSGASF